jgi:actin
VYGSDYSRSAHPVHRGAVKDWDQMELLWRLTLDEVGVTTPESISVLVTESARSLPSDRVKWAEMLFETLRAPAMCIANSAPLSLFASGRTTGLLADCGAGITSVAPIFEGVALAHAVLVMDYGGQDISEILRQNLDTYNVQLDLQDARILKEKHAYIKGTDAQANATTGEASVTFSLPDGTDVTTKNSIFGTCCEQFCVNPTFADSGGGILGQVQRSFDLCDDSLKKEIGQHIVLAGGTSMLPGLGDRLMSSIRASSTIGPLRVVPNSNHRESGYTMQRKAAAWIGGSIVASMDTFKQIKVTRQEWEESGETILHTRSI